jgi:hypothetical protein
MWLSSAVNRKALGEIIEDQVTAPESERSHSWVSLAALYRGCINKPLHLLAFTTFHSVLSSIVRIPTSLRVTALTLCCEHRAVSARRDPTLLASG